MEIEMRELVIILVVVSLCFSIFIITETEHRLNNQKTIEDQQEYITNIQTGYFTFGENNYTCLVLTDGTPYDCSEIIMTKIIIQN